jgi:transcriptional regulator with XRE-family HTH domain
LHLSHIELYLAQEKVEIFTDDTKMDLLAISQAIRNLRIQQNLTVEQLAKKSGFSKGFISQVENFRVTPSLKALNAISNALGVPLASVLTNDPAVPLYTIGSVEQGEEILRNDNDRYGMRYLALAYEQVGRELEPFIIEYCRCDEERPLLMHDTEEFYVLLEGELEFFIADEKNSTTMKAGDTLYMKANLPHKVRLAEHCKYAKALVIYGDDPDSGAEK